MFKQLFQNSLRIMRQPTVKTFRETALDDWHWASIYLAIGIALKTLIVIVINFTQPPVSGSRVLQIFATLAIGTLGFFVYFLFWILLPYVLRMAFGGSKSFGSFTYIGALFVAPIEILDGLFASNIGGWLGNLFLILSLSLDIFRFYFIYINLQATMGLSKGKAVFVALVPVTIALLLFAWVQFIVPTLA